MFLTSGFLRQASTEQLVEISALVPDVTDYTPRQLGNSVETVMNLYTEYARRNQVPGAAVFNFNGASEHRPEAEVILPVQRMYRNTVTLCADFLKRFLRCATGV